jgi:glycine/D-amino acid oxidase-like deaminating enzyme
VLEQSVCGFGASGRNGGWASALYPQGEETLIDAYGLDAFIHLRRVLNRAVEDLGAAAREDGIDAHFVHGGNLTFARSDLQAQRLRAYVEESRGWGVTASDLAWLDPVAAAEHGVVTESRGATYSPHCARLHPARLVRGLGDVVEALGAHVFENTRVTRVRPRRSGHPAEVVTVGGTIHARYVVRATEGYTPTLPGQRRVVVPIYSLMIATDPLPPAFWNAVGFARGETFADDRHLIVYGQRTADDRIAFGGRGSPYHFGSTVEERFDEDPAVFALLESTLHELFPALDAEVAFRWGGPLAMPRDLSPSVLVDHETGLASAGGNTGDGVVLSRVAATALADLITAPEVETDVTRLPFVQRPPRRWEIEPLRWLGVNAGLTLATWADHHERRHGTESRAGAALDRLLK